MRQVWSYLFILLLVVSIDGLTEEDLSSSSSSPTSEVPSSPTTPSEAPTSTATTTTTTKATTPSTTTKRTTKNASEGTDGGSSEQNGQQTHGGAAGSAESSATEEDSAWISACWGVLVAMNIASVIVIRMGVLRLAEASEIAQKIATKGHAVGVTTIRTGLGRLAKESLVNQAKGKSEFAEFFR